MHFLLIGILLGMGAAIPIGPVNLEMIRRNLHFGTPYGIMLGLGACTADITYLILLSIGALSLLQYPEILRTFGVIGSAILAWFAFAAFRANPIERNQQASRPSLVRYSVEGYLITLINPITILFWSSISSQISLVGINNNANSILLTGVGVMLGTVGWVLFLNTLLHFTRHKLNARMMKGLNYLGGFILLGFAITGLMKALN